MVKLIDLINAFVTTLQSIPPLVADLDQGLPDSIIGYIDTNPTRNSTAAAIYQQKPGTVLVIWENTVLTQGSEMPSWVHTVNIYVRAVRNGSPLQLVDDIVNGIPVPGDGLVWLFCPVMDGVLPTTVFEISRVTDEEGIDYHVIMTTTQEP